MLEHELLDPSSNNTEEFVDELFSFVFRDGRLDPQALPDLLAAVDGVGVWLCGLSLLS